MSTHENEWRDFQSWDELHARKDRRKRYQKVPWCQLDCGDVGRMLGSSGLDLMSVRRVIDMGGGHGRRLVQALLLNPSLHRKDVRATCVDLSVAACQRGVALWHRTRTLARRGAFGWRPMQCAVSFRQESVADLPPDLLEHADVLIDNFMLHGLPLDLWPAYRRSIDEIRPRLIVLQCFTSEFGRPGRLPETAKRVDKHRLSDEQVRAFFGSSYTMDARRFDQPEVLNPANHSENLIAAKRGYLLWRRGEERHERSRDVAQVWTDGAGRR